MYISIDVGGSNIRIARFGSLERGAMKSINKINTLNDYEKDFQNIVDEVGTGEKVKGIAIGLPGFGFDQKTQVLCEMTNLQSWEGRSIVNDLQKIFKCKVFMRNDACLAGLGEAFFGFHRSNFWFVAWGTGVGGALVIRDHKDWNSLHTEIGHQIIDKNGLECFCGRQGCLEAYVGGKSIEKLFKKDASMLESNEWEIVENDMAVGLYNMLRIYICREVVLSGGIALNCISHVHNIEKKVNKLLTLNPSPGSYVFFHLSKLGDMVGILGGIALMKKELNL